LYTHVTPTLQCIGLCNLYRSFRWIFLYNTSTCGSFTDWLP